MEMKILLAIILSSILVACSPIPLIPNPGVAVDAQVGKENTSTEQIVAVQSNISASDNADVAGADSVQDSAVLQKDSAVATAVKAGVSKAAKKKAVIDSGKENTVNAEVVEDIISTEKNQDIVIGDNSTVTIVDNSGAPWYMILISVIGVLSVGYWFTRRNNAQFEPATSLP